MCIPIYVDVWTICYIILGYCIVNNRFEVFQLWAYCRGGNRLGKKQLNYDSDIVIMEDVFDYLTHSILIPCFSPSKCKCRLILLNFVNFAKFGMKIEGKTMQNYMD